MEGGEGRRPATGSASFERSQLDHALEILEREARVGRLPPSRRAWFRGLLWYGYSVPVLASLVALLAAARELAAHAGAVRENLPALLDAELAVFVGTVLVFGPLNVLGAVCLFPLSAPLLLRSWRWRRRVRLAGLTETLRAPWEEERARHRVRNALTLFIGPWLVGWGVAVALLERLASYPHPPEALFRWVPVSPGWVLGCALFVLPIGFHYLALHFLLRDMERIAVVRRLIRELSSERERAGGAREQSVLLGSAFRQAARIERAQIARERLQTLRSSGSHEPPTYQVRRSKAFRGALEPLGDARAVRVHDQILRLSTAPHPDGARRVEGTPQRWIDVPGTDLELGFEVDDARRELIVSALRELRAGVAP